MITGDINLGIQHHAEIGKVFLESLGVRSDISELVGMHVQAKRYLVATDALYCKYNYNINKARVNKVERRQILRMTDGYFNYYFSTAPGQCKAWC